MKQTEKWQECGKKEESDFSPPSVAKQRERKRERERGR